MEENQIFLEAIKEGDSRQVEELLKGNTVLAKTKTQEGISSVLLSMYYGRDSIANTLINTGIELDIFEASATGRADRVKELLDEDPTLANAFAVDGFQPLGLAAFFGHKPVVDLLLSSGAQVNSASKNAQNVMPLHSAVAGKYLDISKALLDHGADVNAKQADDFTPLHEAAHNGQLEMVKVLLSSGADRNARTSDGETALSLARKQGNEETIKLLERNAQD